jgi:hypothetical protein
MPLHWIIDPRNRLITITAGSDVSYGNVTECRDALAGAKALGYRRLVDCAAPVSVMNTAELAALAVKVRELHGTGAMGAAALILNVESSAPGARLLGAIAAADRPLRLFKTKGHAKRWIDRLTPKCSAR